MKLKQTGLLVGTKTRLLVLSMTAGLMLVGCATNESTTSSAPGGGAAVTASEPSRMTHSGFLSDYGRLKPAIAGEGVECWRSPKLHPETYKKVMIARMQVTLKPGQNQGVDPTDLKTLTDYFHDALVKALKPQMGIADEAGPGVVVMRIALTDLVPTEVSRSVVGTLVPYGFVAEAGSGVATGRPAGSTPYLGETGIEMQFVDGASKTILAECRDTQIGRKYASDLDSNVEGAAKTWVSGYLDSFDSWAYAKDAFDKWATLTAKRFAELRVGMPEH